MKEIRLWLVTSLDPAKAVFRKKKTTRFCRRPRFSFETVVVVVLLLLFLLLLLLSSRKNPSLSLSLCGEFVRSQWCVPETRKKMDALQRCVPRGRFFYLGFYLGFRKRAKKKEEGRGSFMDATSRRRSDEGDDDDEDDEEEEEEERKEEKDDFPEATTTRAFVRFV